MFHHPDFKINVYRPHIDALIVDIDGGQGLNLRAWVDIDMSDPDALRYTAIVDADCIGVPQVPDMFDGWTIGGLARLINEGVAGDYYATSEEDILSLFCDALQWFISQLTP